MPVFTRFRFCLIIITLAITAVLSAGFLASPAWAEKATAGRFSTNRGPLILYQGNQEHIAGFYYHQDQPAHLFLNRKSGGSYTGFWVQATSAQKCSKKKHGSLYWGTIKAGFKHGNFVALWNYCTTPLINQKGHQWDGRKQ